MIPFVSTFQHAEMARHLVLLRVAIVAAAAAAALIAPRAAGQGYPWSVCGHNTGSFAAKSMYQSNLDLIAATLPKNASASPDLYATAVVGAIPDQVSALGLCRGDANATACLSCLAQAFGVLPEACSFNKDAIIFYDLCSLYYSDIHFLTADDSGPPSIKYAVWNGNNVSSEAARFNDVVAGLVNATADYAAFNSTRRYAAGEADFNREFPKVYSWAQCTPDLSPARCRSCLARTIALTIGMFENTIGARALGARCSYRYETAPFIDGPMSVQLSSASSGAPAPAPAGAAPTARAAAAGRGQKYRVPTVVLIVLLPIVAVINFVACVCFWRRRRPITEAKETNASYSIEAEDIESIDSMLIDISTLRAATGDFTESNKLGEGGFGAVYKGTLPDGEEIAVKRLSKERSTQGVEELKNELALVAKLKHKNLVRLIGVCLEQQERLIVYEFVPNRSLDMTLFDDVKRGQLDWNRRYNIINGIARGLQYLHEDSHLKVVHRDLKASNILLDMNMNPKIADFGLARIFGRDQTQGVTNLVIGTRGYMAPEYVMRGNYSIKSDVFSFGVMVLEIVTGRRNNDGNNSHQSIDLLTMVWENWKAGTVSEMVDLCLKGSFSVSDVLRCIHVGLLCIQGNPVDRPVMSAVVTMLGSNTVALQAPSKPPFYAKDGLGNASSGIASTLSATSLPLHEEL